MKNTRVMVTEVSYRVNLPSPNNPMPGAGSFKPTSGKCGVMHPSRRGAGGKSCPVEMILFEGSPALRFCTAHNRPGYVVKVKDGYEATKISRETCGKWSEAGGAITPKHVTEKYTLGRISRR